jgi:hypothetical protein
MELQRPQKPAEGRKNGHGRKSFAIREQAILALLTERSLERAAERCGVSERTLRRWQAEDTEFKAALESARTSMFRAGLNRVQTLVGRAVDTLEDLLDAMETPAVRLGAARTVVELGIHQHEMDAILRRLGEIEAAQARQRRLTSVRGGFFDTQSDTLRESLKRKPADESDDVESDQKIVVVDGSPTRETARPPGPSRAARAPEAAIGTRLATVAAY